MPDMFNTDGFGLEPGFAAKLQQLLQKCHEAGVEFRVSQGLRTPQTQALYYCQWAQRKPADIDAAATELRAAGAPWLSDMVVALRDTPRKPDWQTNALPGAGWHQWGEAVDCYCYRNNKIVNNGADPAYKTYADLAKGLGLTAGYYFTTHQDSGHVQLRAAGGATDVYSWAYIDGAMKARFSEKPTLK